jgi:pyruvate kinase
MESLAVREAIAYTAATLASDLGLGGIIIPIRSGVTARVIASFRPSAPLIGVSSEPPICRRMALYWGIVPISINDAEARNWKLLCKKIAKRCGLTAQGKNNLLLVSGLNDDPKLNEPALKIMQV